MFFSIEVLESRARTHAPLSLACKGTHAACKDRLFELRGLPVEVWESTSQISPSHISWTLERYLHIEEERMYSKAFRNGPHTWRLLLFPGGDDVDRHRPGAPPHVSVYVDVADAAMLPYGWVREAHFLLSVRNERHPSKTVVRYARHDFESASRDWGFRELIPLADLEKVEILEDGTKANGFLGPDGAFTIQCKVWGVTDGMRAAERAHVSRGGRSAGGGSSHLGASSASSTSIGSTGSREGRARMFVSILGRPFSSLRRGMQRLFMRPSNRRRQPTMAYIVPP